MYKVFQKGDNNRFSRILKLYVHYWVILVIFLFVGFYAFDRSAGSLQTILSNFTGFQATYNGEIWFLFPYALLSLSSSWLFTFTDKFQTRYVLLVLFFVNLCTSFLISRYGEAFFYKNYWAYNPLLYFHLMFSFYIGAMTAKHQTINKISNSTTGLLIKKYGWLLLFVLIAFRLIFRTGAFHALYVYAFIIIFLNLKRHLFFDSVLAFLGKHSMNIWMIHSWFCYYLFKDFIYGFRYPIIILVVLLMTSILSSMVINSICKPLDELITKGKYK